MQKLFQALFFIAVVLLAFSVFNTDREPQPARTRAKKPLANSPRRAPSVTQSQSSLHETDDSLPLRSAPGLPVNALVDEPTRDTAPSFTTSLTLTITGLKPQKSDLYIATFKSAAGFPKVDRSETTQIIAANETTVSHEFPIEHNGTLAIAVFQDLDGNGILSKDDYGIPTEPYGFSNNARGLMGPPSFKQAAIKLPKAAKAQEIRLK